MYNRRMTKVLNILLLVFFVSAVGFSLYNSINPQNQDLKNFQVKLCETGISKSAIVVRFMNQAADTRRNQAVADQEAGNLVSAQANLDASRNYSDDAKQYDRLTVKDCNK